MVQFCHKELNYYQFVVRLTIMTADIKMQELVIINGKFIFQFFPLEHLGTVVLLNWNSWAEYDAHSSCFYKTVHLFHEVYPTHPSLHSFDWTWKKRYLVDLGLFLWKLTWGDGNHGLQVKGRREDGSHCGWWKSWGQPKQTRTLRWTCESPWWLVPVPVVPCWTQSIPLGDNIMMQCQ